MANFYTYPHVNFTTKTTARRVPEVLDSTATKLLAPFTSDRGPENTLVPIDTYADFVATFGQLNYANADQRQLLNIGAWLANGGRVMACRLTDDIINVTDTTSEFNGYVKIAKKAKGEILLVESDSGYTSGEHITEYEYTAYTLPSGGTFVNDGSYFTYDANTSTYVPYTANTMPSSEDTTIYKREVVPTSEYLVKASAKYSGSYYNGIKINFIRTNNGYFKINVIKGTTILEAFASRSILDMDTIDALSDYISGITIYDNIGNIVDSLTKEELDKFSNDFIIELGSKTDASKNGTDVGSGFLESTTISQKDTTGTQTAMSTATVLSSIDTTYKTNLVTLLEIILKQPLETPVDCFIDCGYSPKIKLEMLNLCCVGKDTNAVAADNSKITVNEKRDDIFLFLSKYSIKGNGKRKDNGNIFAIEDSSIVNESGIVRENDNFSNAMILDYYSKVQDIYSENSSEVYVTATYAYANLIPYNDAIYGPHKSTAGLNRGVVTKIFANKWINDVPSNYDKQIHWNSHINYIEKDSRGMYLMSELTCNKNNNILDRVYASRTLIKMKKELTLIGRRVLHEYNDSIVQARLRSECDAYLSTWLQNGALSSASVDLIDYTRRPSLSDNELVVAINIKFKNTIDVIPFEITL